ncbi:unnamed protein product [Urochloa decumbens]|uniref:Uncharacterized protein n=1 Tax=Urochloa decumbens TaxID=240449 RepID=A0ABC9BN90_9POAL
MDARNSRSILIDAVPGRAVRTNDASAMQEILAIDEKMAKTTQKLEADRFLQGAGQDPPVPPRPARDRRRRRPLHRAERGCHRPLPPRRAGAGEDGGGQARGGLLLVQELRALYGGGVRQGALRRGRRARLLRSRRPIGGGAKRRRVRRHDVPRRLLPASVHGRRRRAGAADQNRMTLSTGPSIQKDIFLLENQIPWLVLQALIEFFPVDVRGFIEGMGVEFLPGKAAAEQGSRRRMQWRRLRIPAPGTSREDSSDGFVVSSYLSVLAMLMDSDEDVQKLRAKHVLYSTFSNKQALGFFKGLSQHLRFGSRYFAVLEQIDSYKRQKSVRIAIHRLLYNSFKAMTIATLFSIVGVLVGIFKTLLDNKKQ